MTKYFARFEILTAVLQKSKVFWDVTFMSLVINFRLKDGSAFVLWVKQFKRNCTGKSVLCRYG